MPECSPPLSGPGAQLCKSAAPAHYFAAGMPPNFFIPGTAAQPWMMIWMLSGRSLATSATPSPSKNRAMALRRGAPNISMSTPSVAATSMMVRGNGNHPLPLMFMPARLAVGLEPLSVPGVMRRKPHPLRTRNGYSVPPLIAPKCGHWADKLPPD